MNALEGRGTVVGHALSDEIESARTGVVVESVHQAVQETHVSLAFILQRDALVGYPDPRRQPTRASDVTCITS